jgi:hypothetical protein
MQPNVEVSELCRREEINPSQYYGWKKQLQSSASKIFDGAASKPRAREERQATEPRLKAARFPAAKTLDGFDFAARPRLNKPLLPGRVRVRAGEQGRGRVAVRRDRHRLRALECAADDQPAVGELDRGARQRAVDRGSVRPPDTPLPHRGDDGGELSPAGCQAA